jgi:hypothetical protein
MHHLLNPFLLTPQECTNQITFASRFGIRQYLLIGVNIVVHLRIYQLCLPEKSLQANLVIFKKVEFFLFTFPVSQVVLEESTLFYDYAFSYCRPWV